MAAPDLFRRMDPATAGTVGFLSRLTMLAVAALSALRIAGLDPPTLAVGGAFTAVVIGLAAQQTLGNLIAGMVLIGARPFRVGDRVRLQAGGLAGQIEGVVASLGLLYTTFAQGEDSIMVPNNVVLGAAVVPLREPAAVDLRARLRPGVKPSDVQALLEDGSARPSAGRRTSRWRRSTPTRSSCASRHARVRADGPRLADEVLAAIAAITREGDTDEARARKAGEDERPARREDRDAPAGRDHRAQRPALALLALALGHLVGDRPQPRRRWPRRRELRREAGRRGAHPHAERRDVDLRRLRSIARTTAAATCSGVRVGDVAAGA